MKTAESVSRQIACALAMVRETVAGIPPEEWRRGDVEFLVPARLAYHLTETVAFYICRDPKAFSWGQTLGGGDCLEMDPSRLPAQEEMLAYLKKVEASITAWLGEMKDDVLTKPDGFHYWPESSPLDRALYVMRHIHHHLGELFGEMHRRGLERPSWR